MSKKTQTPTTQETSTTDQATMSLVPSRQSRPRRAKPQALPPTRFIYVVKEGGQFVGSPTDTRTKNPNLAATWTEEAQALAVANAVGGVVATRQVPDLAPTPSPLVAAKPARTPKAPRGLDREQVMAAIRATGLALHEKGSTHAGGFLKAAGKTLDGARLVLPPSKQVTRLYLYKMPEATALAGWLPEEKRPGAVTHQADDPTWEQFRAMLDAVCQANGIQLRKDGTPAAKPTRRSRKATPAQGTEVTPSAATEETAS